jgi:hypothetical protein
MLRRRCVAKKACLTERVFENSSCKPVTARYTTISPCDGPTLSLRCDRWVPIHLSVCQRPPTSLLQRRQRLCRARPCMLAPSIPVTSQMPNGPCWRRSCQRPHGVAARAPGRCGSLSTRFSMSYARAVPGAICHGSIPHGKRPIRHCASGAWAGYGRASTRRYAARCAYGRDATPTPRQRSWI